MNYKLMDSNDNFIVLKYTDEALSKVVDYWTKERLENATPKPLDLYEQYNDNGTKCENTNNERLPVEIADTSIPPFNAGGKLFFTVNGVDYVASAEFCSSKQMILTTAHCFYDHESKKFAENVLFCHGYDDGVAYREQLYVIEEITLDNRFVLDNDNDRYLYDYAFGVTQTEANCEPLAYQLDVISGNVTSFGYPHNYEEGQKMVYVEGEVESSDKTLKIPDDPMKGGCSGGAWVKTGTNKIISVNSATLDGKDVIYGPIFSKDFESLLNYTKVIFVPVNAIRYFTLHNKAAVVARMQICWELGTQHGVYEESGYHDVCAAGERTVDLLLSDIPDGATVQLKVNVVAGKDSKANETFIYDSRAAKTVYYELSGTTLKNKLKMK